MVATEGGSLHVVDARSGAPLGVHRVSTAAIQASPLPLGAQVAVAALDGTPVVVSTAALREREVEDADRPALDTLLVATRL